MCSLLIVFDKPILQTSLANQRRALYISELSLGPLSSHSYSFLCGWWHQSKEHCVEIKHARKSAQQRRKCSDVFIHKSLCGLSVIQGGWIEPVASVVLICETFRLTAPDKQVCCLIFFSYMNTANTLKLHYETILVVKPSWILYSTPAGFTAETLLKMNQH